MNPTSRIRSLDVFRGLTVAGMILVNNPGTWGAMYPPLAHAEWDGWTPTDLILPEGGHNAIGVEMIQARVREELRRRGQ